jgi:hypothetical protein
MLKRKTAEHEALKQWINADAKRKAEYAGDIEAVEKLIAQRDAEYKRDYNFASSKPRLLNTARTLYRLANENTKPDAERKSGYQQRDVPRIKSSVDALVRNYDEKVDKALVLNSLVKYAAQPAAERNAAFDAVVGIKDGMSKADLQAALDKLYAGSKLGDAAERKAWLERKPEDFKASDDAFIKAAVALYEPDLKSEADDEELGGKLQQAYGNYMKAKIAYMNSKARRFILMPTAPCA